MTECIFCKMVNGEIPTRKVYEDDSVLAFLTITPEADGHTVVIPKEHYIDIFDIDEENLKKVIVGVRKVAKMVKENLDADGVNIINNSGKASGQEVEHIHFHVIPRHENDKRFLKYDGDKNVSEDLDAVLKKLRGEENESE